MRVFGISDLHLSFSKPKPMEIFGKEWQDHFEKKRHNWHTEVGESDVVVIPGDVSWAMALDGAIADLNYVDDLPGRKIMLKGNHDYWWQSIKRLRERQFQTIQFIQNDVLELGGLAITGTRLWDYPFIRWGTLAAGFEADTSALNPDSESPMDSTKVRNREIDRFSRCVKKLRQCATHRKIMLTHFPPVGPEMDRNIFTDMLADARIDICAFGHIHALEHGRNVDLAVDGVRYVMLSCDSLGFKPKLLCEL